MNKSVFSQVSVLLVEDEESARTFYDRLLRKHLQNLYLAQNGLEGLEAFKQHQPDIIITDVSLPIMQGLDMVRLIKEQSDEVRVVIVSAYDVKDYLLDAIDLSVNGYLIKPIKKEKLFKVIRDQASHVVLKNALKDKERKRRLAERNLKKSLEEKDLLLREIHHRVKNNMQIISSILSMQERVVDDSRLQKVLAESKNRIRSMALVHENLYQHENLASIWFPDYVRNLVASIARTYQARQPHVSFEHDIAEVFLPMDIGIPCGLIVNELVSNSLKYAFPENTRGLISISLKPCHSGEYVLEVADNGIGMDEHFGPEEASTLGMRIVHALAQQIDADLSWNFANGAKYTLRFKQ